MPRPLLQHDGHEPAPSPGPHLLLGVAPPLPHRAQQLLPLRVRLLLAQLLSSSCIHLCHTRGLLGQAAQQRVVRRVVRRVD